MKFLAFASTIGAFITIGYILGIKLEGRDNLPVKSLPEVVRIDVHDREDTTFQLGVFVSPNLILMSNRVRGQKFLIHDREHHPLKVIKEETPFRLLQTEFINDKWAKFSTNLYHAKVLITDFPNLNRHTYDSETTRYESEKNRFMVKGQMYLGAVIFDKEGRFIGLGYLNSEKEIICYDQYIVRQFLTPPIKR